MITPTITFYRSTKCGYYQKGETTPEGYNLDHLIAKFKLWINGIDCVIKTATYDKIPEKGIWPTYCYDIASSADNEDHILITWNETHHDNGEVLAINGTQPVGEADVESNKFGKDKIPGYPTYFWINTKHKIVAAISINGNITGNQNLQSYFKSYLEKFTPWAHFKTDKSGNREISYYKDPEIESEAECYPAFSTLRIKSQTQIDQIRANVANIQHILCRSEITTETTTGNAMLNQVLKLINFENLTKHKQQVRFDFSIKANPTINDLDNVISKWESEDRDAVSDIGFRMKSLNSPIWLSGTISRITKELNATQDPTTGMIPIHQLLQAITSNKQVLIGIANKD